MLLTSKELIYMDIFWRESRALTVAEIVELSNVTWAKKAVYLVINSLMQKEVIEVESFTKYNNHYSRTFKAKITFEEYSVTQIISNNSFTANSVPKIVSALIDKLEVYTANEKLRAELIEIIKESSKKPKRVNVSTLV